MQLVQFKNMLFISLLLCLLITSHAQADTTITITSGRGEPFVNSSQTGFYDLIVKTMFKRIGLNAKTVLLPSERSLINAETGIDDGNIARIKGIEKKYKNLVMVPEKIIDFDFVVFTKNRQLVINAWKDLAPYNVSFINGWKLFEKKVKSYKSLVKTRDTEQLFNMLNNNRVDIVLYDLWSGIWWTKMHKSDIDYLKPPVATFQLYLYLNKKHTNLVPGLTQALKDMKKDGTYKKIYNSSLKSLIR